LVEISGRSHPSTLNSTAGSTSLPTTSCERCFKTAALIAGLCQKRTFTLTATELQFLVNFEYLPNGYDINKHSRRI